MIKKTIKYYDYNDVEVTEDFYFNFDKLEMLEMEISHEGGVQAHMEKLIESEQSVEIYNIFKELILKSVGRKSEDGRRFLKNDEIRTDFEMSPALPELIYSFFKNGTEAADFVKGLLPARALAEAEAEAAKQKESGETPTLTPVAPVLEKETKATDVTDEELLKMLPQDMTQAQLQRAYTLKTTI